eukprot:TRINITY_DN73176_c0_g1_i2.p2 TRINITY_DN73176_c0_g1~~TRINITY_DN73176_c0_g1_i2.p2  ORF type:complete len:126 (-),score=25.26 TRINITY_DN73176_c0_g1_i2:96-473(-)
MSLSMKTVVVRSPMAAATPKVCRPGRVNTVNVCANAQESRRALLGGILAVGALIPVMKSEAITIPSQDSMGGLGVGGGSLPKSTTAASMSAYSMEGTKKRGISPKRKSQLLAKVKEAAKAGKGSF